MYSIKCGHLGNEEMGKELKEEVFCICISLWTYSGAPLEYLWFTVEKRFDLFYTGSLCSPSVQPLSETRWTHSVGEHQRITDSRGWISLPPLFSFFTPNGNFSNTHVHILSCNPIQNMHVNNTNKCSVCWEQTEALVLTFRGGVFTHVHLNFRTFDHH